MQISYPDTLCPICGTEIHWDQDHSSDPEDVYQESVNEQNDEPVSQEELLRRIKELENEKVRSKKKRRAVGGVSLIALTAVAAFLIGMKLPSMLRSSSYSTEETSASTRESVPAAETVTAAPTATPTAAPTATPTAAPTATPTPTPTYRSSYVTGISASSTLPNDKKGFSYYASHAMDGDSSTAWCENSSGNGIGEYLLISFDRTCTVHSITVKPGYQKNEERFYQNNRPQELTITVSDGSSYTLHCTDSIHAADTFTFPDGTETDFIKVSIKSVYAGNKWSDTLITDISIS